ncbi:LOW QUALITY PROTEIN: pancreatic triacylglycerol lipase [Dermatophagoides farinae]|uniref:LOW QUALITY PROTEIN: pancreatic triacylglycerol lipase n=1 Tax=Dermatophagoides farinae TaxID=6954 RepID=UPI003F60011E
MQLLSIIISIVCLSSTGLLAIPLYDHDGYIVQSIYNSTRNLITESNHCPDCESRHVCYDDIGCFSMDGPMGHVLLLPQSPKHIRTQFLAFKANDLKESHSIDAYDHDTFNVIDTDKKIAFIIHGFAESHTDPILMNAKDSLLKYRSDEIGTVIMVDWKHGATAPAYTQAATNTQVVGRQIAFLCNQIHKSRNVNVHNFYLVGFSLGGQVSGFAGKWSRTEYHWKFGRITGLDAAAPSFEGWEGAFLTKEDADFVDGIHTTTGGDILAGQLGFTSPYAHIDFYPNGGLVRQPHCPVGTGIACSHKTSVLYFEASISAEKTCHFSGHLCDNYQHYLDGKCKGSDSQMGFQSFKFTRAHGNHYLLTSADYPFCDKN